LLSASLNDSDLFLERDDSHHTLTQGVAEPVTDIRRLFEPESIAVIGASHHPDKIGYRIVENIVRGGYRGRIYPVNPKGGLVVEQTVYPELTAVPGPVDVAVIAIPAQGVFPVVEQCARKKVRFLVVISSGFGEVGRLEEERQIVRYARQHSMRILGPNVFGYYSAAAALNASFGPRDIVPGRLAIITQSGALGVAMIGKTALQNIGLSAIISVGNKADLDEADLLDYLVHQPDTRVILMYIEGIRQGEKLVALLRRATREKPVVVIKAGRSRRGAVAAASHTGSLAGADEVFDAIMKQCGVLRAENIQEALDWCGYLSTAPLPRGENTVIVTNGGGVGVLATDACEKYGVKLYGHTERLKQTFEPVTPPFGSTKNPIDLTGQSTSEHYEQALEAALSDPEIQAVMMLYCETAMMNLERFSRLVEASYQRYQEHGKPLLFSIFGGAATETGIGELSRRRIPVFREVYAAAAALGALMAHYRNARRPREDPPELDLDFAAVNKIVSRALAGGRNFLLAHENRRFLKAAGIAGPRSTVVRSIDAAVTAAENIGYPVVMKVVSPDILHKSDVGGVLLNLESRSEVLDAYEAIVHNCKVHRPDARLEGIEIGEQLPPGREVIVGGRRDRAFGPIVMFGLGGIYVEVMKDVAFRALPVSEAQVRTMIKEVKSYPLLLGVRGERKKDIEGIVTTILKVGTVLRRCPRIADIEINPLFVYDTGEGVKAVDVRILLTDEQEG
jgi:acetyltransferase